MLHWKTLRAELPGWVVAKDAFILLFGVVGSAAGTYVSITALAS
jgi:hypothetical protein